MKRVFIVAVIIAMLLFVACKGGDAKQTGTERTQTTDVNVVDTEKTDDEKSDIGISNDEKSVEAETPQTEEKKEETKEPVVETAFSIYGTWTYVRTTEFDDMGGETPIVIPEYEGSFKPTLVINRDNTIRATFYSSYTGTMSTVDSLNFTIENVVRSSEGELETVDQVITLLYNPETKLLRYAYAGWFTYFRFVN
jgi:hypothetical protein